MLCSLVIAKKGSEDKIRSAMGNKYTTRRLAASAVRISKRQKRGMVVTTHHHTPRMMWLVDKQTLKELTLNDMK